MYSFLHLSFSINIVFSNVYLPSTIMYIAFVDFNKSALKKEVNDQSHTETMQTDITTMPHV